MHGGMGDGGLVLWIILALGLGEVLVFFERLLHMRRAAIDYPDFLKGIRTILGRGNDSEAVAICEDTPGPVAALVRTAIQHRHEPRHAIREAVDGTGRAELSRLERRIGTVATITYTAPLFGLLGTILGMIETLLVLRNQIPLVDASQVSGGLLHALVTTAAGLMVATPGYAMYNLLVDRIDRMTLDMEAATTEIIAFLSTPEDDPARAARKEA